MEVFNISSIKKIDKQNIIYINSNNQKSKIDLNKCRRNWVSFINRSDNFVDSEGNSVKITEEQSNCVGRRDWFSEKPYYEFFSDSIIRFEIITKKIFFDYFKKYWKQKYYNEFRYIEEELVKNGWTTFDLG
ncbi:MAG: hypothetical protein A2086_17115 [Spirochaetes bacterium GWD1_27_9]|nr:MAG: hypothetical protein A2Z98_02575 [Spirochaetes bacterium GWB1_27_13]OHD27305.1 MAG: hypothetical protein A2Y34_15900 [Spirochaetes bacterium GWC1_27_15]OHD34167.1 MAG: hypothetical protein A2086_17115 [Spirochaetes bacterium GWD1_27_9]